MKVRRLSKTGHDKIDLEHNELIYMLNSLSLIIYRRTEDKTILKFFDNLLKSAEYHIQNEEKLMINSNYPNIEEHKKQHLLIIKEIEELQDRLQLEIKDFKMRFLLANKHWLKHLYKEDKPFVKYLKKKS